MEKLEKIVPIADIFEASAKDGKRFAGYETMDGRKYILFAKKSGDPFAKTTEEAFDDAFELGRMLSSAKEGTEITVTHLSAPSRRELERYEKSSRREVPEIFSEVRRAYAEMYGGKRMGMTYLGIEKSDVSAVTLAMAENMGYESCSVEETVFFLYFVFNPSEIGKVGGTAISSLSERIKNEVTVAEGLYLSQIEEKDGLLFLGDTAAKIYKLVYPPADLEKFRGSHLLRDVSSANLPFMVAFSVTNFPAGVSTLHSKVKASKTAAFNFFSNINPIIADNAEKTIAFSEKTRTGIARVAATVAFFSNDRKSVEETEPDTVHFVGAGFMRERFDPASAWFFALPGMRNSYYDSFLVSGAHAMMLCDVPPTSSLEDALNLYEDKGGETRAFRFHDPSRTVNSMLISARTGRGKSVLLNQGLAEYFEKFYPLFETLVIDYGGSYKSFVERLNEALPPGEKIAYLAPSSSEGKTYNPFDLEFGSEITKRAWEEKSKLVINFFETAFPSLTEDEKSLLRSAVPLTYEKFFTEDRYKKRKGGSRSAAPYVDIYFENPKDAEAFLEAMPTVADLIPVISGEREISGSFPRDTVVSLSNKITNFMRSPYTKAFSETSSEPVTSKRIVLDIKPATMEDESGTLATLFFMYYVNDAVMRMMREEKRNVKKLIVLDEYPRLLAATPKVENILDMLLKTGRKENADVFAVAQNVSTFNPSFVENSGGFVTFKPATPDEAAKIADFLGIDADYASIIETLETVKGKYTEFCHFDVEKNMAKSVYRSSLPEKLLSLFSI